MRLLCTDDGSNDGSPVLGSYSGSSLPSDVTATGDSIYITFSSDGSVGDDGFQAHLSCTTGQSSDGCTAHAHRRGGGSCACDTGYTMAAYSQSDVRCVQSSCAYTNDGHCDEPEGSNVCADGTDVADCGTGACWEAYKPDYPSCSGYEMAGYVCVRDHCAALDPAGTPDRCASQGPPGSTVDRRTGTCSAPDGGASSCANINSMMARLPDINTACCSKGTDM
jgi:hypothetical protein